LTDNSFLTDLPLAGELVASNFEGWPDWLKTEFVEHAYDGHVADRGSGFSFDLIVAGDHKRRSCLGWVGRRADSSRSTSSALSISASPA
jgi:hypothetical protein